MTKRIFTMLLALAMVLALAACGGNNSSKNEQKEPATDNVQNDAADNTASDNTVEDSKDDTANNVHNDVSDDAQADTSDDTAVEEKVPALNRNDFTLKNAGDSFRLEVENLPEDAVVSWSISDEAVATIAEDGTVTAVAHGTATATAAFGDVAMFCIVRVTAKEESAGGNGLAAFYESTIGKYEMPMLMLLEDKELLDNFFPGLTSINCSQLGVYFNMMSFNYGEMAMAEAANAADVETIKAAFQARVDYMIESSMFYAESNEIWTNKSRVVSVGNYVLMVASPHCDSIVDDFKAFVK